MARPIQSSSRQYALVLTDCRKVHEVDTSVPVGFMSSKVREVTTTSKHFQTHESFFQRILGQKFKNAKRKSQDRKLDIKDRSCEVPVFATIQTPNRELAIIGDTPTPSRRSTPYQRRYTSQQDDESLPYITTLEAMIDQRDISAECSGEQWSLEWEFFIRCYSEASMFWLSDNCSPIIN